MDVFGALGGSFPGGDVREDIGEDKVGGCGCAGIFLGVFGHPVAFGDAITDAGGVCGQVGRLVDASFYAWSWAASPSTEVDEGVGGEGGS